MKTESNKEMKLLRKHKLGTRKEQLISPIKTTVKSGEKFPFLEKYMPILVQKPV